MSDLLRFVRHISPIRYVLFIQKKLIVILFENKERSDLEYALPNEGTIEFLDRSGHPWAQDVRDYLNNWISKYPEEECEELITRLKHEIDSPHFELFLHELFVQMGFEIICHPQLEGTNNKPDFLVSSKDKAFYAEARLVTETTDHERKVERHKEFVRNTINNKVRSKNFFIGIRELQIKSFQQVSLKKLTKQLTEYLSEQDPDSFIAKHKKESCFEFENEYIFIEVSLIPKNKEHRSSFSKKIIGMSGTGAKFMSTAVDIKKRISKKAGKYGNPKYPFVICLNLTSPFGLFWEEVSDALYGSKVYNISTNTTHRKSDGIFGTVENPKLTRVSGILMSDIHHMTIHKSRIRYYQNPHAAKPLTFSGTIDEVKFQNQNEELITGKTLQDYINALNTWHNNST